ncbi:MAG: radical SAM protein [Anaerocolumna sp.]
MKVFLIFPSSGIENRQGRKEPLGVCYISAYLRKYGHTTRVIDQIGESDDDIIDEVHTFKPDAVGFSTMTYNYPKGLLLATRIKNEYKDIPIIFGGVHASGMPDIVKEKAIDFVSIGEGEKTILELVNALEENAVDFEKIKGISYLKDGKVFITAPRERITNLDDLPFPDRTSLPMRKYRGRELKYLFNRRMATIHTARGCSGNCTFCTTPVLYKGGWIARSAKNIVDEIEQLIKTYHIKSIFFADEDFMKDKNRVYEICDEIIRRKIIIAWFCFSKITDVEITILRRMKEAGCINIMIGIEAMHDDSLKKIAKKITVEKIREAIKIANKTGLLIGGTYMIGYPWETNDDLLLGLRELKKLRLDHIYLNFITPFPGTPFYKDCEKKGLLDSGDFTHYDCYSPIVGAKLSPRLDYRKMRKKIEHRLNINIVYAIKVLKNVLGQYKKSINISTKKIMNIVKGVSK